MGKRKHIQPSTKKNSSQESHNTDTTIMIQQSKQTGILSTIKL